METSNYGSLIKRIKAVIIDLLVWALLGSLFSYIFSKFEDFPDSLRLITFIFVFLLYDPIFTCLLGGTIGHFALGLRIRKASDENEKINFSAAFLRFIFKTLLGWISLLTVSSNAKKQAIHDSIAKSIVLDV